MEGEASTGTVNMNLHDSSQAGKQGTSWLPWEHLGCRERNSCVPSLPAEGKGLGGVASLINPAASIFYSRCPPHAGPLRNEARSLRTTLKCFPGRDSSRAGEKLTAAVAANESSEYEAGNASRHQLVELTWTSPVTYGPWFSHL